MWEKSTGTPKGWRDQSTIMFRRCKASTAPSQRHRPAGSILPLPCAAVATIKRNITWHRMTSRTKAHCLRGGECQCHVSYGDANFARLDIKDTYYTQFSWKYSSVASTAKRIYNSLFIS